ncbi:MAG: 50S ribosomal protein L23 [Proteobacteria bacterium]|nr:50S ribosomal protein L23 [Pseudomonadota bacterium]
MTIRPYKITPPALSDAAAYGIILRPIITEKIAGLSEGNTVGFVVPLDANKPQIKAAVEKLYKVKVEAVRTLVAKGKVKRFRGRLGKRKDEKKALVTLAKGESIDMAQGV